MFSRFGRELVDHQVGTYVSKAVGTLTASEAAEWVGRFCFAPDTLVHTEKGLRAIASIKPGEKVWS